MKLKVAQPLHLYERSQVVPPLYIASNKPAGNGL